MKGNSLKATIVSGGIQIQLTSIIQYLLHILAKL
jgi:hypothetical protein